MTDTLNDPLFWFLAAFIALLIESFDGSFTVFSTAGLGALGTSIAIYLGVTIHPLIVFGVLVVVSYMIFRRINQRNSKNDNINKY